MTPVLPGETARAVFVATAPTVPGIYRVILSMARDEVLWPTNGDLYQQADVRVTGTAAEAVVAVATPLLKRLRRHLF